MCFEFSKENKKSNKVFDTDDYLDRIAASSTESGNASKLEEKLFNNLNLSICVGTR